MNKLITTTALFLGIGIGVAIMPTYNHFFNNDFDFDEYGKDSSLILKVEINKGNLDNPKWEEYRKIAVDKINYKDQSAIGRDNKGNHLRASIERYDPYSMIKDLARR